MDASDSELQPIADQPLLSAYYLADMISRRAEIGWSTHGHSSVDVNIYSTSGAEALRGNRENTEIGKFLRDYLEVDVNAITEELKKSNSFGVASGSHNGWNGPIPSEDDLQLASNLHGELYGKHPVDT
jgi:alkaline phosphatase